MNSNIQNLAMLSAVIAFAGCNSNKAFDRELKAETVLSEVRNIEKSKSKTIEGTVKSIFYGKDGFVANVYTTDNLIFVATISRTNLKDPSQYRNFNVSEVVKITGDLWRMNDEDQITVREIL